MASNFDFLLSEKIFASFAGLAVEAEEGLRRSPSVSAVLTSRALERAIRWVFIHDVEIALPYRESMPRLMHESTFLEILPRDYVPLIRYIVQLANLTAHREVPISQEGAALSLESLHYFLRWLSAAYGDGEKIAPFDASILPMQYGHINIDTLQEELLDIYQRPIDPGRSLFRGRRMVREEAKALTKKRKWRGKGAYVPLPSAFLDKVRWHYTLVDGAQAGWMLGQDVLPDFEIPDGRGGDKVDFVLFGSNGAPAAIVERKVSLRDLYAGVRRAKEWADRLEKHYGQRPYIFTVREGGFWVVDEARDDELRPTAGLFSQKGIERRLALRREKMLLQGKLPPIRHDIANRPYQMEAVQKAVSIIEKGGRNVLLSMPPATGKTNIAVSLMDALARRKEIGCALYLVDRDELAYQAMERTREFLPNVPMAHISEAIDSRAENHALAVFSTYAMILDAVGEHRTERGGRIFNPAHFDLIIIDESHPSIYMDYTDLLHFFDAPIIAFTSLPPQAMGEQYVYDFYERNEPTWSYTLQDAIREGYVATYERLDVAPPEIMDNKIRYENLSPSQRMLAEFEYSDSSSLSIRDIDVAQVNNWLFNEETISLMLEDLLDKARKDEKGRIAKTIIFAKNSLQARAILFIFQRLFPSYEEDFVEILDTRSERVREIVRRFRDPRLDPRVIVSVDVLDTGVDLPDVENLVFFRKVHSLSRFVEMLGRGMRKPQRTDGQQKSSFLVIDYCKNFDFFSMK